MNWKPCLALLGMVAASCGGHSVTDGGAPSSATAGTSPGGMSPVGGYGVAGTATTSRGGSPSMGAQGGGGGTTSNMTDAGVTVGEAGMSCRDLGAGCFSKPSDASCMIDADCLAVSISACWNRPIIGISKQGKIICVAPPCVPPPPGTGFQAETQDCRLLVDPRQAGVRCTDGTCLTYFANLN